MTASLYMADVVVEIAFGSGWSTPAASRVWTDVSAYVELDRTMTIAHGRGDEHAQAEASRLSLVFDNRDGRFTPELASSPYYPNVKIGVPIRVTATPPGGVASTRFVGSVDEWPVEWGGVDDQAWTPVTATGRTARINGSPLSGTADLEILATSPAYYWPLSEAAGATEGLDAVGTGPSMMSHSDPDADGTPAVFGGPSVLDTDSLPAATVTIGGRSLRSYGSGQVTQATAITMIAAFRVTAEDKQVAIYPAIIRAPDNTEVATMYIVEDEMWVVQVSRNGTDSSPVDLPYNVWDGEPHVVAMAFSGGPTNAIITGYLDGTQLLEYMGGFAVFETIMTDVQTGIFSAASAGANEGLEGQIGRVGVWHRRLSDAEIADLSAAMLDGFAEDSGARVERVAAYAGIASTEVSADTDGHDVAHQATDGRTPLSVLRDAETTEGGVLFDGKDGALTFHARERRYTAASAFTLDMAAQEVGADYAPVYDRTSLQNDVTVSLADGTASVRYADQASIDAYGPAGGSVELASSSTTAPYERATWLVNTYADPKMRVPSLTVDLLTLDAARQALLLSADVGTRFTVSGQPVQMASSTGDYFIEGWTETIGPESYSFTLNVSDATPLVSTFILDDATRGVLDSTYTIAY